MKKIFTLVSIAFCAMSAQAQDSFTVNEEGMRIVSFSTANVEGTHVSGPVAGYKDATTLPLERDIDNKWGTIQEKALSADGSVAPFYYVQGKGNPVNLDKVTFEEVVTDGVGTGMYRAYWNDAYYLPDGSAGFPTNGTYVTLTSKVAGTMKVAVWINKGSRDIYVVKKSDAKALALGTEVIASGYVNGANWDIPEEDVDNPLKGYPTFQENIEPKGTEGDDAYVVGAGNQASWVYLTFNAVAGETYYVFNKNTQVGFGGFGFTFDGGAEEWSVAGKEALYSNDDPETGISEITAASDANAPVYNIAGQRVSNDTKGLLIKNGKKFINK